MIDADAWTACLDDAISPSPLVAALEDLRAHVSKLEKQDSGHSGFEAEMAAMTESADMGGSGTTRVTSLCLSPSSVYFSIFLISFR